MISFSGQVVIVTGGGRGLGRLYAMEIARRGGAVVVNDLGGTMRGEGSDSRVADRVVEEIRTAGGIAMASYDSVATPQGGVAIVESALEQFGRLDAVISNAGIFGTVAFEDMQPEEWRRMLNVHLDGSFYLSQPAYKVMKSQGYGRFVFVSSSAALFGMPHAAHYAAAKGGIFGLSNVLAVEGAAHGILANSVLPTGNSRMVTETVDTGEADDVGGEHTQMQNPFLSAIDPKYVVPIVVFLASRDCEFTHHNYAACAGRFSRVFVGLAQGWLSEIGYEPTADDIAVNIARVAATEPHSVPASIFDEVTEICELRGLMG
jgi:NAD(P)-dependent dehydrogenase (short-subunit alcohol dehydrogenase family)